MPDYIDCKHCTGELIYAFHEAHLCSFCQEKICNYCFTKGVICPKDTNTRGLINMLKKIIIETINETMNEREEQIEKNRLK